MAYSDEDLQKYLKKAQEVLNSKNEDYLSNEDLNDIAKNLGLDIKEITKAKNDYLIRGKNHLNFGNYNEAITEFEQLLLLAPNEPNGLHGLAKSYLEKWHQDGKRADKDKALEYANACIEADPQFQDAYLIINELKQKPQGKKRKPPKKVKTQKPKTKSSKAKKSKPSASSREDNKKTKFDPGALMMPAIFIIAGGIYAYSTFFHSSRETFQYRVASTPKGLVIWQMQHKKLNKKPWYKDAELIIADAASGKLVKKIKLEQKEAHRAWDRMREIGGKFYYYYRDNFETRDILTGKVIDSNELLDGRFPEIKGGVGKVSRYSGNWLKIVSKQGTEHYYNILLRKLLSKQGYDDKQSDRYNTWNFKWAKAKNPKNSSQYKYLLTQILGRKSSRKEYGGYSTDIQRINKSINRGYTRLITNQAKSNYYLKPKAIYSDSTHMIFKYQTEIGKEGQYRMACLDRTGNVLWEKGSEDFEVPLLKNLLEKSDSRPVFARYKNTLGISSVRTKTGKKYYKRNKMAAGIDLNTGKTLWKYSPKFYNTKFKSDKK